MEHGRQIAPASPQGHRACVIGVGHESRGDDAVGLCIADLLSTMLVERIDILKHTGEERSLTDLWRGYGIVIVVGAANPDSHPGSIWRLDVSNSTIPDNMFRFKTHTVGIGESARMARFHNALPPMAIALGIEGVRFGAGEALSLHVENAIPDAISMVCSELQTLLGEPVCEKGVGSCTNMV